MTCVHPKEIEKLNCFICENCRVVTRYKDGQKTMNIELLNSDIKQMDATICALQHKVEIAKEALESCISGTHMWVITPESELHCKNAFDYIRDKANKALEKIGK